MGITEIWNSPWHKMPGSWPLMKKELVLKWRLTFHKAPSDSNEYIPWAYIHDSLDQFARIKFGLPVTARLR